MGLQKYLERIGCGVRPPSLEHLSELQERHLQHVPFETLSLHLDQPIDLNMDALLEKLLDRRRGGFCYELNSAFAWLLKSLGYDVRFLMTQPFKGDGTLAPPFAHLALKVVLDGQAYLVDVGFNDGSVHPFPLIEGHVQNGCTLQKAGDIWTYIDLEREKNLYVFTLQEHPLERFFEMCSYYSTAADSGFRKKMFCGFQTSGPRTYLSDRKWVEGSTEHVLDLPDFMERLKGFFGVSLTDREIHTLYQACLEREKGNSPAV